MKAIYFVTSLLVAAACAVGIPAAVAGPTATVPSPRLDLNAPALSAGAGDLPGPIEDNDPAVAESTNRNVDDESGDDVSGAAVASPAPTQTAPTDQAPDPCLPAGQSTTPPTQPSTEPDPSQIVAAQPSTPASSSTTCGPDGTAGFLPITPPECTINATSASQVNSAKAGDTVCLSGNDLARRPLRIIASGTESAPIIITGDGNTTVRGIKVNADNVVVQGLNVIDAAAPGVQLQGNNLTLQNTKIDHPTGGDHDGIRYFGDGIKILHNHITNITNTGGAHADCMQSYATTTPTSHNVLIDGNRCENIDNQCLIAQGPHSKAGDGSGEGESSGLTFSNNYCDAHASQAVHIDDIQNVTMVNNDIQGRVQKAFNFINNSTGVKVDCNKLGPGVGREVIMDRSSRIGYQDP